MSIAIAPPAPARSKFPTKPTAAPKMISKVDTRQVAQPLKVRLKRHPRVTLSQAMPRPAKVQRHWSMIDGSWDYSEEVTTRTPPITTVDKLPDPTNWGKSLALSIVETLTGQRYPTQLERWITPDLYEAIERRVNLAERLDGPAHRSPRAQLLSSRTCRVNEQVAETVHILTQGERVHAVSIRLEARRRQWMATALEII
ncbi:MAG: Rv3235 family protein [Actinomycetaceae bacterium]|nr:Rv3235 family protein [Actinomycetaceae bacterium]